MLACLGELLDLLEMLLLLPLDLGALALDLARSSVEHSLVLLHLLYNGK